MRDTITEAQVVLSIMAGTGVRPSPNVVAEICRLANKYRSHRLCINTTSGTLAVMTQREHGDPLLGWWEVITLDGDTPSDWLPEHTAAIRAANDKYGLDWLLDPQ